MYHVVTWIDPRGSVSSAFRYLETNWGQEVLRTGIGINIVTVDISRHFFAV